MDDTTRGGDGAGDIRLIEIFFVQSNNGTAKGRTIGQAEGEDNILLIAEKTKR